VETTTVDRPSTSGPDAGLGGNWMVIVENDSHNTFDHVAQTLARVIPGVSIAQGHRYAETIHNSGRATVWTGPREPAELYWEQLREAGLTMAPLEKH
jgi:ATP-dependent Clp protease adaptor protein ClpS